MKRLSLLHSRWVRFPRWLVGLLAAQRLATSSVGISSVVVGVAFVGGLAPSVQAYTVEALETVYRVEGEDYNALVRRAEGVARASAQQKFDSDILLTRVIITVLGQNGGQTAPILELDVNRNDWRRRPDPQYWAKYYRSTRVLLQIEGGSAPLPATSPTPSPTRTPSTPPAGRPGGTPLNSPRTPNNPSSAPNRSTSPSTPSTEEELLPSGANSPPSINIPATPPGQVGLPRSILR